MKFDKTRTQQPHHLKLVRFVNIDQSTSDGFVSVFKTRQSQTPLDTSTRPAVDAPTPMSVDDEPTIQQPLKRQAARDEEDDDIQLTDKPVDDSAKKPKLESAAAAAYKGDDKDDVKKDEEDEEEDCVICMCPITDGKKLDCGHRFCADCIDEYFTRCQPKCPSCGKLFGVMRGNQPPGNMNVRIVPQSLAGYDGCQTIRIDYNIPDGIQTVSCSFTDI